MARYSTFTGWEIKFQIVEREHWWNERVQRTTGLLALSIRGYVFKLRRNHPYKECNTCNLTIYTFDLPQYRTGLSRHSITYVHVKNTTSKEKPYAQNSIGKRRPGDELVYYESRNVTNTSRFPSRVFEYSGSEYLTYVGFSFNVRKFDFLVARIYYEKSFHSCLNFSHQQQWHWSTPLTLKSKNSAQLSTTWTLNISLQTYLFMGWKQWRGQPIFWA